MTKGRGGRGGGKVLSVIVAESFFKGFQGEKNQLGIGIRGGNMFVKIQF